MHRTVYGHLSEGRVKIMVRLVKVHKEEKGAATFQCQILSSTAAERTAKFEDSAEWRGCLCCLTSGSSRKNASISLPIQGNKNITLILRVLPLEQSYLLPAPSVCLQ
jgi:hypothetical protein